MFCLSCVALTTWIKRRKMPPPHLTLPPTKKPVGTKARMLIPFFLTLSWALGGGVNNNLYYYCHCCSLGCLPLMKRKWWIKKRKINREIERGPLMIEIRSSLWCVFFSSSSFLSYFGYLKQVGLNFPKSDTIRMNIKLTKSPLKHY